MNELRIMTYNIHRCIGVDRKVSPERIAAVIAGQRPDIVALQEVDCGQSRPAQHDQAATIASLLATLLPSPWWVERERCGNVVLSRHPMRLVRAGGLRRPRPWRTLARRGALWVEVVAFGRTLQVIATHLGLTPRERLNQAQVLAGPDWLAAPGFRPPAVLCGDFNALPGSPVHRLIGTAMKRADELCSACQPDKTWPSPLPILRIDHLFVSGLGVTAAEVPSDPIARVASDHLPLVVTLTLPAGGHEGGGTGENIEGEERKARRD